MTKDEWRKVLELPWHVLREDIRRRIELHSHAIQAWINGSELEMQYGVDGAFELMRIDDPSFDAPGYRVKAEWSYRDGSLHYAGVVYTTGIMTLEEVACLMATVDHHTVSLLFDGGALVSVNGHPVGSLDSLVEAFNGNA